MPLIGFTIETEEVLFRTLLLIKNKCLAVSNFMYDRPDQTTLEGSSGTSSMTCTGGCGCSF